MSVFFKRASPGMSNMSGRPHIQECRVPQVGLHGFFFLFFFLMKSRSCISTECGVNWEEVNMSICCVKFSKKK